MSEFFNWNDTSILWQFNWLYLLIAFALGLYTGWTTCEPSYSNRSGS
jgi:hypothetical protein